MGLHEDLAPEFTVLLPCLNEARTVGLCIDKAQQYFTRRGIHGEVLVADNGSADESKRTAEAKGARVIDVQERGYGATLIHGICAARGKYVIMADADDSYDLSELDAFVHRLRQGVDLVMGNRFTGEIKKNAMPFTHRYIGNPVLSAVGRFLFGNTVGDYHCGLRAFSRNAIKQLGLTTKGMEFATEMVVKASLYGLKIEEVPIILYPDGRERPPHLRSWRDGWRHLRFLLLLSPRWLFLYPGSALATVGLIGMVMLMDSSRFIFGLTFDVNTLVFCSAAFIGGVQLVIFSVLSKILAVKRGLHPKDHRVTRVLKGFRIEYGIVIGVVLIVTGVVVGLDAVAYWGDRNFGDLITTQSLRIVVPSATLWVLGVQVTFSSFFLSLMKDDLN